MGYEGSAFSHNQKDTFIVMGIRGGVKENSIGVVLVSKFFDYGFGVGSFKVCFCEDKDVVTGGYTVANCL